MRRVAVCIPVFNGGRTIARTIENLLLQTYKDFEIIVYDDGSTDFTANIVARLANGDSRIRLVRGGVNRGRGLARNALLELTSGRLIAWQDADDSWAPGHRISWSSRYASSTASTRTMTTRSCCRLMS